MIAVRACTSLAHVGALFSWERGVSHLGPQELAVVLWIGSIRSDNLQVLNSHEVCGVNPLRETAPPNKTY